MKLDEMSFSDVISLYYEKRQAMREGNIVKLIALKKKYPEIFIKEKDAQIEEMIAYVKAFQESERYKELCRLELKEKLFVINNSKKQDKIWWN